MRLFHWILAGAVTLGVTASSLAQYPYRNYRPPYYPYGQRWQQRYTPPAYYPPPSYQDPDYGPPAPQDDGRHLWVYGQRGEGSFRQLRDGSWVESNPTGTFYFREVNRTPDFVELYDASRGASARLTPGLMYHHGTGDPVWHPGHRGDWQ
jgi:hypothetical protein